MSIKKTLIEKVYNAEDLLKKGIKNLDYIIINNKSGFEISKGEDSIKKIEQKAKKQVKMSIMDII